MKNISKSKFFSTTLLTAGAALVTLPVLSVAEDGTGVYVGGSYGVVSIDGSDFDDDNDAQQIFVGGRFNSVLGIEATYIDFGRYGGSLANAETDGYGLALTGRLPLTDSFSLFGKVGQFWWDSDVEVVGFDGSLDGKEPYYGVGLAFAINDHLEFSLGYDRFEVDLEEDEIGVLANGDFDSEIDLASAGLKFQF